MGPPVLRPNEEAHRPGGTKTTHTEHKTTYQQSGDAGSGAATGSANQLIVIATTCTTVFVLTTHARDAHSINGERITPGSGTLRVPSAASGSAASYLLE
jgi:hypothetical protein